MDGITTQAIRHRYVEETLYGKTSRSLDQKNEKAFNLDSN